MIVFSSLYDHILLMHHSCFFTPQIYMKEYGVNNFLLLVFMTISQSFILSCNINLLLYEKDFLLPHSFFFLFLFFFSSFGQMYVLISIYFVIYFIYCWGNSYHQSFYSSSLIITCLSMGRNFIRSLIESSMAVMNSRLFFSSFFLLLSFFF